MSVWRLPRLPERLGPDDAEQAKAAGTMTRCQRSAGPTEWKKAGGRQPDRAATMVWGADRAGLHRRLPEDNRPDTDSSPWLAGSAGFDYQGKGQWRNASARTTARLAAMELNSVGENP